jgi:hypothetical protein
LAAAALPAVIRKCAAIAVSTLDCTDATAVAAGCEVLGGPALAHSMQLLLLLLCVKDPRCGRTAAAWRDRESLCCVAASAML